VKITKFVDIQEELEVEVDITFDDLAGSITDDLDLKDWGAKRAISNFHNFITKVPDSVFAEMKSPAREITINFYKAQIQRFEDNPYMESED